MSVTRVMNSPRRAAFNEFGANRDDHRRIDTIENRILGPAAYEVIRGRTEASRINLLDYSNAYCCKGLSCAGSAASKVFVRALTKVNAFGIPHENMIES